MWYQVGYKRPSCSGWMAAIFGGGSNTDQLPSDPTVVIGNQTYYYKKNSPTRDNHQEVSLMQAAATGNISHLNSLNKSTYFSVAGFTRFISPFDIALANCHYEACEFFASRSWVAPDCDGFIRINNNTCAISINRNQAITDSVAFTNNAAHAHPKNHRAIARTMCLFSAASQGNIAAIHELSTEAADTRLTASITISGKTYAVTPIALAAICGQKEACNLLADKGGNNCIPTDLITAFPNTALIIIAGLNEKLRSMREKMTASDGKHFVDPSSIYPSKTPGM